MKKERYELMTNEERKTLENLRLDNSTQVQNEAFDYILNNNEFNVEYLLPPYSVIDADLSAEILLKLGFERTKDIIHDLFMWLQDLSWEGSITILKLLMAYPNDYFIPNFEKVIKEAYSQKDEEWLEHLVYFLHNEKVKKEDFVDQKCYEIIKNYE